MISPVDIQVGANMKEEYLLIGPIESNRSLNDPQQGSHDPHDLQNDPSDVQQDQWGSSDVQQDQQESSDLQEGSCDPHQYQDKYLHVALVMLYQLK